jgi:Fic family protein
MNLKLETEFSKAPILQEIDALKKQIDDVRPLSAEIEGRVMQKLRLDWNYNSNAIEGNKLSYGETTALLMHGITAKGKPLKDHLDIKGHNEAVGYLERIVQDERNFTEADIRALHEILLVKSDFTDAQTVEGLPTKKKIEIGKYKSSPNHVKTITGEIHYYATPEETPALMNDLMDWYVEASNNKEVHPVVLAALFHHKFVAIHPFDDGNGRMSRILTNLILMKNGYPIVVIKDNDKDNYYSLLSQADVGDNWPFVEYIIERLETSLNLYVKAINGGDVDEDEDIDKEIALLKMQLTGGMVAKDKKARETISRIFYESILPLSLNLDETSKNFHDFFFSNQNWIRFNFIANRVRNSDIEWISKDYKEKYDKFLLDKTKDIQQIGIELGYQEYRNPENNFNITTTLIIQLENYYYKIYVENELVVSKLYHEKILKADQSKIINIVIKDFKTKLSEHQKSPKS